MTARGRTRSAKGPFLWALLLALLGLLLLLNNFLLLGEFNLLRLAPLLLVILGVQLLLRGDILPSEQSRTFGITRGSVESGSLEINAGEIDVTLQGLGDDQTERLIAGQYAYQARPILNVDGTHAALRMERSHTPWFAFVDWEVALAANLPWRIAISTHLGQVELNLATLITDQVLVSSGLGDIRLVCPSESLGAIHLHSLLGRIHVIVPEGYAAQVTIQGGRLLGRRVNETRYEQINPNTYLSRNAAPDATPIDITIRGIFGDLELA